MIDVLAMLPVELWTTELGDENYEFLRRLIYEHSRINLGPDKKALVTSRIAKRLRALRLTDYNSYCGFLRSSRGRDEVGHLVDVISTNHTQFFRESRHFDFLRDVAVPQWLARGPEPIRAWSAACSSGEEAYTLAIVLSEALGLDANWTVLGTDISSRMLATARSGIYSADRLMQVLPEKRRRHFERGVGDWQGQFRLKEDLRRHVSFAQLNLLERDYPIASQFDVVFCRNVMIYFDRDTQETLAQKLAERLRPGGYLMVGHSESLAGFNHGLVALHPALYQRPGSTRRA